MHIYMMSEDVPLKRDENEAVLTYIVPMEYFRKEDERMTDVRASGMQKVKKKRNAKGQFIRSVRNAKGQKKKECKRSKKKGMQKVNLFKRQKQIVR